MHNLLQKIKKLLSAKLVKKPQIKTITISENILIEKWLYKIGKQYFIVEGNEEHHQQTVGYKVKLLKSYRIEVQ